LLNSGTLSPNPWDLTLSGQNDWFYTGGTRTEDKAPQGCNLSADSSAGMAPGGFDADAAPNSNSDPSNISLLRAENGLDNGVHFRSDKNTNRSRSTDRGQRYQHAGKQQSHLFHRIKTFALAKCISWATLKLFIFKAGGPACRVCHHQFWLNPTSRQSRAKP
jgi:hypothetical protein